MKEAFLHFVWKYKNFDSKQLKSTYGESIEILNSGIHNNDQGPDFLNAKIKIGDTIYAGHIEIHVQNEDWYKHLHQNDSGYNNVILHVVFENTSELYTLNQAGHQIPILCLKNVIDSDLIARQNELFLNSNEIKCLGLFKKLPENIKHNAFLQRLVIERFENKSNWMYQLLHTNKNNYENTFYQILFWGFGLKINAPYFLDIAIKTPQIVLAKCIDDLFQLEAILLGQAQIIDTTTEYGVRLQKEYQYLAKKFQLVPTEVKPKYSKLYPSSFPTFRLAQFAAFIHNQKSLYSKLVENRVVDLKHEVFDVQVSDFWKNHYSFKTQNQKTNHKLSHDFIQKLYINSIIPLIYLKDRLHHESPIQALEMLMQLGPEKNSVIKIMQKHLDLSNKNAFESQALLQWYNYYCKMHRCTDCIIGFEVLR
jgi:hypothetical protein